MCFVLWADGYLKRGNTKMVFLARERDPFKQIEEAQKEWERKRKAKSK